MTGAAFPWWGWLILAQSGFVYALYGYIRQLPAASEGSSPSEAPSPATFRDWIGPLPLGESTVSEAFKNSDGRFGSLAVAFGDRITALEEAKAKTVTLSQRVADLETIKRAIVDDYQRMCGMEARYNEAYEQLRAEISSLAGVPEKLEMVRVDGAIATRDLVKLSETMKDHRERAKGAFNALRARERMQIIEGEIRRDAADLIDRLRAGEQYDSVKWQQ